MIHARVLYSGWDIQQPKVFDHIVQERLLGSYPLATSTALELLKRSVI